MIVVRFFGPIVARPRRVRWASRTCRGQRRENDSDRIDGRRSCTVIPLEVYVSRVLAGEGEPRAAEGAQQALAIAIRTYTLKNVDRHARDGFDLCDSTHCQVPRPSTPSSRRAAMATAGQVLTYRGDIAEVFYSASCGGRSERAGDVWPGADYPYLIVRKDDVCEDDPEWTADFTLRDVKAALARVGFEGERLENVRVDARTTSGRAARLHLSGLRPDVIGGNEFRLAVGAVNLRSTAFSVDRDGESLRFTGHGFGHGVGMCVIGAGRRAMRGESARAILAQYYPGLDLTLLSAVIPSAALTASPPRAGVPASAAAAVVPPGTTGFAVVVPRTSPVSASELERMAVRAHADLAKTLGTSALPNLNPPARHPRRVPHGDEPAVVGERGRRRDENGSRPCCRPRTTWGTGGIRANGDCRTARCRSPRWSSRLGASRRRTLLFPSWSQRPPPRLASHAVPLGCGADACRISSSAARSRGAGAGVLCARDREGAGLARRTDSHKEH